MRRLVVLRVLVVVLALAVPLGLLPLVATAASPYTPAITLSPGAGPVGTLVTITGSGYGKARGATVTLSLGGTVYGTATVGRDGTFAFAPVAIPGVSQTVNGGRWCDVVVSGGGTTITGWFTVTG